MGFDAVAECQLECVSPDGSVRVVRLRVGRPYSPDGQDWCCPVAADGLRELPLRPAWGVDSWQALRLAQALLAGLVQAEIDRGATLHWPPGSRQAIGVADLFGIPEFLAQAVGE